MSVEENKQSDQRSILSDLARLTNAQSSNVQLNGTNSAENND